MCSFNMHDRNLQIFMALTWTETLRVLPLWLLLEVPFEDGDGLGENPWGSAVQGHETSDRRDTQLRCEPLSCFLEP